MRNHVLHLLEPTIDAGQPIHVNHQYDVMPTPMQETTDRISTPVTKFQQNQHHQLRFRQNPSDVKHRNVNLQQHQQKVAHRHHQQAPHHRRLNDEAVDLTYNRDEYNRPSGARRLAKLREIGRLLTYPRVFAFSDQDPLHSSSEKYANFTCAGGTVAELLWNVSFEQQAYRKKSLVWSRR